MGLPIFFVSYARQDIDYPNFRENLQTFVEELAAEVAESLGIPRKGVAFVDEQIPPGELWSEELGAALMQCRVGLPLYSASYFTRPWCGQEFQVLLNRSRPGPGGTGIVPVRWAKTFDPPTSAAQIQFSTGSFPPEYAQMGMRKLVQMKDTHKKQYGDALGVIADRIVAVARADRLAPLASLDFPTIPSAWDVAVAQQPQSHTRGNISKTCFVFVAGKGWGWVPYEGTPSQIGALAQKISGELGLQYEEIRCDATLPQKLREANKNGVPTVLLGDPVSLANDFCAAAMREYDQQYLLNCASLIVWEPGVKDTIEADPRWLHLKTNLFRQKVANPPPHHEWRSIFSREDLDQKTRTVIEQIRSRLLNELISGPEAGVAPRKAEDPAIVESAAARGIPTRSLSHLEGSPQ
jgi:hypothetical protein